MYLRRGLVSLSKQKKMSKFKFLNSNKSTQLRELLVFVIVLTSSISILQTYNVSCEHIWILSLGKIWWFLIENDEDYKIYSKTSRIYHKITAILVERTMRMRFGKYLLSSPPETERDHHLDALRGIASIVVIVYHTINVMFVTDDYRNEKLEDDPVGIELFSMRYGTLMVPVFVCLSGFVLTKVYWGKKLRKLTTMFTGRATRFFPLHWFAEAVHLPVNAYMAWHFIPDDTGKFSAEILFRCLSLTHMWTYAPTNEASWNFWETCNGPAWSLSVEWGVNIIMFLSITLLPVYASIFLFENIAYYGYYSLTQNPLFGKSFTAALLLAFFCGCLVQKLTGWFKLRFIPFQLICDAYIASLLYDHKNWLDIDGNFWVTVLTSTIIVLLNNSFIFKNILSLRVFTFFGTISFSIYLCHYPILIIFRILAFQGKVAKLNSSVEVFQMIIFIFFIATMIHYLFEKPAKILLDDVTGLVKRKPKKQIEKEQSIEDMPILYTQEVEMKDE